MADEARKKPRWTDSQLAAICKKVCHTLEWGGSLPVAARSAGISLKSLKEIVDYGKEQPEESLYGSIVLRIGVAADSFDLIALETLKKAAMRGHVRAAAEILRIRGHYIDADKAAAPIQKVVIKQATRDDIKKA